MASYKKAVALLSSGLDSSIAMVMAREQGYDITLAVTIDYCQRAARIENEHAAAICRHYKIKHLLVSLPWFSELSHAGALLCAGDVPHLRQDQLNDAQCTTQSAKAVWVPNRNGMLLEVAAAFAEDREAEAIVVGFNREEAATFPDNTPAYMDALTQALKFSTSNGVKVLSPTVEMNKQEIVQKAKELNFPLELIWSCYEAGETMCGECESCQRLRRALTLNGLASEEYFANAAQS